MHEVNVLDTSKPTLDGHIHNACMALSIREVHKLFIPVYIHRN